jgi:hypothetical protein
MKKNIFIYMLAAAGLCISLSGLNTDNGRKEIFCAVKNRIFINGIFNTSYGEALTWNRPSLNAALNLGRYRELNFNAVQQYDGGSDMYGWHLGLLINEQGNNFAKVLDLTGKNGFYGFYERSFFGKYCYGQRLIYEVSKSGDNTGLNFGFIYTDCMKNSYEEDGERSVLHAVPGKHGEGYLCRNIYENLQHGDLFDFRQDDKGTWHIKPEMRIPANMPDNIPVVRIETISFSGKIAKQVVLNTQNFKNNGEYAGKYTDTYSGMQGDALEIRGDDANPSSLNYGRNDLWWEWDDNCKTDFRVFWYGKCEVWFDRMVVDDNTANELFDLKNRDWINERIRQEAGVFSGKTENNFLFTDEILISQYPCIKFVLDELRKYNENIKVSMAVTNYLQVRGLKNDDLGYRVFLDSLRPDFLQADHHGFYTDKDNKGLMIPSVFSSTDEKVPPEWFANKQDYNDNLQKNILGSGENRINKNETGSLIYEIEKTRNNIIKFRPSTVFIMQPQIHGWIFADTVTGKYRDGLREPTNEEIQVQAAISLARGAEGICWFVYNSHIWKTASGRPHHYMTGMLNPDDDTSKRIINLYGQNKWQYVSEMNAKLLKWKDVLENSVPVRSFSIHNEGENHYFIGGMKSYYRNQNPPYAFAESNPDDVKYWEAGFFNPLDVSDKSRYVLIVNRRCIPEVRTGAGDIRMLKLKFNGEMLEGADKWSLKDVNSGQEIIFNKNISEDGGYIFLGNTEGSIGYFLPGEGKLLKLTPAG